MAELKMEKHWIDGGNLYVKVSSEDREKLTSSIRGFVTEFVMNPENKLSAWASAGVEKCECPMAYDPANPEADPIELGKTAAAAGRQIVWEYSQVVKLTRGI
jgi:hypothetical protein